MDDNARGEEFITLYNELDHFLKKKVGVKGSVPFWKRVRIGATKFPALRQHMDDLLEFHELRNAIVHHRAYPKELIAAPSQAVVDRLGLIVEHLVSPQKVMPRFKREIHEFADSAPLAHALSYMNKQQFRQIVVRQGKRLALVTDSGIARWLLAQVSDESLSLAEAKIGDILPFESKAAMAMVSKHGTVDEARGIFETASNKHPRTLFAIVITETGQPDEKPLGIITPRELLSEE